MDPFWQVATSRHATPRRSRTGTTSEDELIASAHRVVEAARRRWTAPVTILGESLGTGVACAVAGDAGVERVALISSFRSLREVAQLKFSSVLPVSLLLRDTYRSDLRLAPLRVPLHVAHGAMDDVVPFASGQGLFDGYEGPKSFTAIATAKHNYMAPYLLRSPEAESFRRFVRGDE
jgi:fermentation-respiration switch protein FrsA (DUF1100 family)